MVGTYFSYMSSNKSSAEYYYFSCFSGAGGGVVMGQRCNITIAPYHYLHVIHTMGCTAVLSLLKFLRLDTNEQQQIKQIYEHILNNDTAWEN